MARSKHSREARKPPQQTRARVTVAAILDGAIRVLEQEGHEAATTSRIAEVAGVSVGTLYQYFANRDAIVDALQEREFERATEMLERTLGSSTFGSEREVAHAVIGGLLELYRAAPSLHRLFVLTGLHVTPAERVRAFDLRSIEFVRSFLSMTPWPVSQKNPAVTAFILYQSVRATMLAYLLEAPPSISDQVLVEELTDLVLSYLQGRNERRAVQSHATNGDGR